MTPANSANAKREYVLCEFNGRVLGIPQPDVLSIEHGEELIPALPGDAVHGWFTASDGCWPVFALTHELSLERHAPASYRFIVLLRADPVPLGLMCESVRLAEFAIAPQALPAVFGPEAHRVESLVRLSATRAVLLYRPGCAVALFNRYLEPNECIGVSTNPCVAT